MDDVVQLTRDHEIAIITIDNPPVNALSPAVAEGIARAVEQVGKDDSIEAVVPKHLQVLRQVPGAVQRQFGIHLLDGLTKSRSMVFTSMGNSNMFMGLTM